MNAPIKPRLADAGCQREAERRELTLEISDGRELTLDHSHRRLQIHVFVRGDDFRDAVKDFKRAALWWPEAQAGGNGVDLGFHLLTSSPKSDCWPFLSVFGGRGGALGRFSTLRL
jgi:hypothetical protein